MNARAECVADVHMLAGNAEAHCLIGPSLVDGTERTLGQGGADVQTSQMNFVP